MKTVPTYTAQIHVGTRVGYSPEVVSVQMAREWLQEYVNGIGLCVTLTETEYIYKDGNAPGFVVGLINYPRFPSDARSVRAKALHIAGELMKLYGQLKVTVVFPDETLMLQQDGQ